ncbi:MAG: GNAT family N-acetyltransferase [Arachnia sp.]
MHEIRFRVPERADFPVRQRWLADPRFMSYNAGWRIDAPGYDPESGCIDWPEERWTAFEERLALPESTQGYYFVEDASSGEALGHAHYLIEGSEAAIGLNIAPDHRGEGLGHRVLAMLIDHISARTSADTVVNEFEDERAPALRIHQRAGFRPDENTTDGYGRPVRAWRLALRPTD